MIDRSLEAEILRLYHAEHWPIGTLAKQLRVHHATVRRVLAQAGLPVAQTTMRPSMIDPFRPFIDETLQKYPSLCASRLYQMVKERGYPGAEDHFRAMIARLRPRPTGEAYLRLRTLPGEQGQVDWAHFGKVLIGRALRPLMGFVMVLSYSRKIFLRFYLNAAMDNFLRGHVDAFTAFGAVPRVLLYDNLKSAVLERRDDAIRFHPTLLELAAHYRFQPRPVAIARGNEKGRVERAIRYVRDAFFAARTFKDIDDLNAQATAWSEGPASERRCPEDRTRTVQECFVEEQTHLLALPDNPFMTEERHDVKSGKSPYVRFDFNDYSIPHTHIGRPLLLTATLDTVRIVAGETCLATHPRSFDKGAQIEQPQHIEGLVLSKRAARRHRAQDQLLTAAPSSQALFLKAAERGHSLGALTRGLLQLLQTHGAAALEEAVVSALASDRPHLGAVRHFIDVQQQARRLPPPIAIPLPDNPKLQGLQLPIPSLDVYAALTEKEPHDE
jgi:transposase